jgi:hypothetical protein
MTELPPILRPAALAWAVGYYQTDQVFVTITQEDDDDLDRFLALIAAANQPTWQAAELWLEHGVVVAINDLGEGIPPDDTPWPW